MKIALMQPTFFPWLGYFNLLKNSDIFCFYDDAQFSKSSYHSRTHLIQNSNDHIITVPTNNKLGMKIQEVLIDKKVFFLNKLRKTILLNLKIKKNADFLIYLIDKLYSVNITTISDFNITIINEISKHLQFNPKIIKRSTLIMNNNKDRNIKVFDTLNTLGCSEYICGITGFNYLSKQEFIENKINPLVLQIKDDSIKYGILYYLLNCDIDTIKEIINKNFYYKEAY